MQTDTITVHGTTFCPFCVRARLLLRRRGLAYTWIDVSAPGERARLAERTGRPTVPQVFIGERHVGGFDDLSALDRQGGLRALRTG
jgi:glutaredoxin 3